MALYQGGSLTAGDFEASHCQRLVLVNTPTIHVADTQLVDAESELSFPCPPLNVVDVLAFLDLVLVVRNFNAGILSSFPQPLHALLLVCPHAPTVAACEGVE